MGQLLLNSWAGRGAKLPTIFNFAAKEWQAAWLGKAWVGTVTPGEQGISRPSGMALSVHETAMAANLRPSSDLKGGSKGSK